MTDLFSCLSWFSDSLSANERCCGKSRLFERTYQIVDLLNAPFITLDC